jgi:hypothetical protein
MLSSILLLVSSIVSVNCSDLYFWIKIQNKQTKQKGVRPGLTIIKLSITSFVFRTRKRLIRTIYPLNRVYWLDDYCRVRLIISYWKEYASLYLYVLFPMKTLFFQSTNWIKGLRLLCIAPLVNISVISWRSRSLSGDDQQLHRLIYKMYIQLSYDHGSVSNHI